MFQINNDLLKRSILLFLIISVHNISFSQNVNLSQLINATYGGKMILGTDSLLFISSECSSFIDTNSQKNQEIKIVTFKNKEQLLEKLSVKDSYLLKINLTHIFRDNIVLVISIYKINSNIFNTKNNYLVFHDERKIECVINKSNEWIYFRTLKVKSHITD